jgi:Methyltransferase domain
VVEHPLPTKVVGRFLDVMAARNAPVLIDLGAVVGTNVTFLGERLGCKLTVEDVYADIERFASEGKTGELASFFSGRFPRPDASIDGVLCWDAFDYLDKSAATSLGAQLARLLKPGGALVAFFATTKPQPQSERRYTRFVIKDDKTLAHRTYGATQGKQHIFTNRDIELMFAGLKVSDSFLLLSKTREVLLRK